MPRRCRTRRARPAPFQRAGRTRGRLERVPAGAIGAGAGAGRSWRASSDGAPRRLACRRRRDTRARSRARNCRISRLCDSIGRLPTTIRCFCRPTCANGASSDLVDALELGAFYAPYRGRAIAPRLRRLAAGNCCRARHLEDFERMFVVAREIVAVRRCARLTLRMLQEEAAGTEPRRWRALRRAHAVPNCLRSCNAGGSVRAIARCARAHARPGPQSQGRPAVKRASSATSVAAWTTRRRRSRAWRCGSGRARAGETLVARSRTRARPGWRSTRTVRHASHWRGAKGKAQYAKRLGWVKEVLFRLRGWLLSTASSTVGALLRNLD